MNKTLLALASILFFGPFVHYTLKTNESFGFSEEEKKFIMSYVILGYLQRGILLFLLFFYIFLLLFSPRNIGFLSYGLYVIVFISIGGLIGIMRQKTFFTGFSFSLQEVHSLQEIQKKNEYLTTILLSFLPGYNFWLWYKYHFVGKTIWRIKESLLWWFLRLFFTILTRSNTVSIFLLFCIFCRVLLLALYIEPIPTTWKQKITMVFTTNIEEIWSWIYGAFLWLFSYCRRFFLQFFYKSENTPIQSIYHYIKNSQQEYSQLYDFSSKNITLILSYVFMIIFLIKRRYTQTLSSYVRQKHTLFFIFAYILVVLRYGIMIFYRKFPRIPFFYELIDVFLFIGKFVFVKIKEKMGKRNNLKNCFDIDKITQYGK